MRNRVIATMLPWTLTLLSVLVAVAPSHGTPLADNKKSATRESSEEYRLPNDVVPVSYSISIKPEYPGSPENLKDIKNFRGIVIINARVEHSTKEIVLHIGETIKNITEKCVFYKTDTNDGKSCEDLTDENLMKDQEPVWMADTEKYTIPLRDDLVENKEIKIILKYTAEFLEGGLTGFYVSTYEISDVTHALLTTKFEPTHARKAFPCFDEPALKAKFDLTIDVGSGIKAISNTDIDVDGPEIKFKTTPKMSTYLLAFIVYEEKFFVNVHTTMQSESEDEEEGLTYRTWGTSNMIQGETKGGSLSQVEGPAAINFLEEYTGIPYMGDENVTIEMTKIDMAAIPDFASGAMENWGLVTYRESSLIYNQQTGTTANYKRVVDVIDHELTHMWFGNLVTTNWWSSIWLNEGFARYMQYLVAHHRYPNWHMLERFVLDEQMGAFGVDASVGAAPLTDETVLTPTQIGDRFGTISYSKGGAILRQISNVMGEENFRKGIKDYLQDKAFDSATPNELFEFLAKYHNTTDSGLKDNVQFISILKHWTEKAGYPVITVERTSNTFNITQKRFLLTSNEVSSKYPIYLTWTTSKKTIPESAPKLPQRWIMTEENSVVFDIDDLGYNDWVLFNSYQGGYYRVNYDDETWVRISNVLDERGGANLDRIAPLDRAALVDNALALARAGDLPYERAFRLLRFLRHDTAFEPWAAARSALAHVQRMLGDEKPFQDFIAFIVEKAYNATGFDGRLDAHIEKVHRTNVLSLACGAGYERCLEETKELLNAYLLKKVAMDTVKAEEEEAMSRVIHKGIVHPDVESVVFCYGLKGASPQTWEKLWSEYKTSDAARRSVLITALGCIDHRETLREFLMKSVDGQIRSQDAYTVFSSVYSNTDGGPQVALDFLSFLGYDTLEESYGAVRNAMKTLMSGLANRLMTKAQKQQFEAAVQAKDGTSRHDSDVKTVESNIEWLDKYDSQLLRVLEDARTNSYSGGSNVVLASTIAVICGGLMILLR